MTTTQSVVVPVEPTVAMWEAARKVWHSHERPYTFDCTREAFRAMLAAVPAPSSLAGGEVREKVARIVDPETFALIAHYTGIDRFDGLSPAEREPSVFKAYPDLKAARDAAYADAAAILAALSLEAPARDDDLLPEGAISGTDDGQTVWLESHTGGAHELGVWGGLSLRFEEADGSHSIRNYVDAALTPRHEAPAALCDHGHTDPMALCSDCEAASVEAQAEGAGEDEGLFLLMKRDLYYRPAAQGYTGIKDNAGRYTKAEAEDHADEASGVTAILATEAPEFSPACFDDLARAHLTKKLDEARREIIALRARSSAPEAREEALGNLLAVIHRDGGHRAVEVGVAQAAVEAEKIVANLLSYAPEARDGGL